MTGKHWHVSPYNSSIGDPIITTSFPFISVVINAVCHASGQRFLGSVDEESLGSTASLDRPSPGLRQGSQIN